MQVSLYRLRHKHHLTEWADSLNNDISHVLNHLLIQISQRNSETINRRKQTNYETLLSKTTCWSSEQTTKIVRLEEANAKFSCCSKTLELVVAKLQTFQICNQIIYKTNYQLTKTSNNQSMKFISPQQVLKYFSHYVNKSTLRIVFLDEFLVGWCLSLSIFW